MGAQQARPAAATKGPETQMAEATTVVIPEEAVEALDLPPAEAAAEVRLAAAVKLFEVDRLSSGKAAALAGMPRAAFLTKLGEFNVLTFRLSEEELREDLSRA